MAQPCLFSIFLHVFSTLLPYSFLFFSFHIVSLQSDGAQVPTTMIMINRELIRLKVVQLVYAFYQNDGKTLDVAEKELKFSLSKAYDLYKYLLSMLVDLKAYGDRRAESSAARAERLGTKIDGLSPDKQFAANKFLLQLTENKALGEYREKKQEWPEEPAFVKKLYTTMVESDLYQNYLAKEDFSYEADRELIRKLYKTYVCNNEDFDSLLEEHSLYWNDDKEIVDSFVMKTIKRFKEDSTADQELLPDYAAVEDKEFAGKLFTETLKRAQDVRQLIRENSKNWEFNRLAFMDVIIMQIALAEILTFPQIPLNVTFNEYLDIAKVYSTPKSASYINGLLDHVVKSLKKKGLLMK